MFYFEFSVYMTNLLHRNDKSVTVHNKHSKIPPSTSAHPVTRVRRSCAVRLSESSRFLMQAAAFEMPASNSSHVSTFLSQTSFLMQLHKQKMNGVRSGDSNGSTWVTIQNYKHTYLNFCSHNDRYYHYPKY